MIDAMDYGIVANVATADRVFRLGAKAWIAGGTGGAGLDSFEWIATSRGGRVVRKWAPTKRFSNFRDKWIPAHLDQHVKGGMGTRGNRREMEELAAKLNENISIDVVITVREPIRPSRKVRKSTKGQCPGK